MNTLKKCYTLKRLNFLLFLVIIFSLSSQLLHAQSTQFEPNFYYKSSINLQKSGMIVLGSWAGLNIISGIAGNFMFENERKYFYQMNAAWNFVNLGLATFGYLSVSNSIFDIPTYDMLSNMKQFNRVLLINAGLDLLYIGTGMYLLKRGLNNNNQRFIGYGKSVVLQGGFLLLFDIGLYLIHSPNSKAMVQLSDNVSLSLSGVKVTF